MPHMVSSIYDSILTQDTASRPQLVHTESKQSIAASDDYYSLASDSSGADDRTTVLQYHTPTLQMQSPGASRDRLHAEPIEAHQRRPLQPMMEEEPVQWPPAQRTTTGTSTIRPITQQRYQQRPEEHPVKETQSTARDPTPTAIAASRGLTSTGRSPTTPGLDDTPYIHFAIDQLTRDEEALGEGPDRTPSQSDYSQELPAAQDVLTTTSRDRRSSDSIIRPPETPPLSKQYVPTEPVVETYNYPKLNFVPRSLQWPSLIGLILSCLIMIALLITNNVLSIRRSGLWDYDGVSTSRYFLFQYFPQILATLIILWLLSVHCALYRIFAFDALASDRKSPNSRILHEAALFPTNYLIPDFRFFGFNEPLLGLCSIFFWLSLFTIPLQGCLFQTRYFIGEADSGIWRWTACQPVGWTLLVLYFLLVLALLYLLIRYARRITGIKWESSSLADILILLARSNALSDFNNSENPKSSNLTRRPPRRYRLGYWHTVNRSSDVFHALGRSGSPPLTQTYSEKGKTRTADIEAQSSPHQTRYTYIPWFLRDSSIAVWLSIAFVLTTALLIVSFVHHPLTHGFQPQLPAPTTTDGFSPADFLYSFLPSLLGLILSLLWLPIDNTFRSLQPFATMNTPEGSIAENSLLLEYTRYLPFEVSLRALAAKHWKVAYISFISPLSLLTLPTLSGGIFTAQYFRATNSVRTAAAMPGYIALLVFLVIYALSYLAIFPGKKRHLPHGITTLGQIISFLAACPALGDEMWRRPVRSKIELVTRVISEKRGDGEKARWRFGDVRCEDGRVKAGLERIGRGRMGAMF